MSLALAAVSPGEYLVVNSADGSNLESIEISAQREVNDGWISPLIWIGLALAILGVIAVLSAIVDVRPLQERVESLDHQALAHRDGRGPQARLASGAATGGIHAPRCGPGAEGRRIMRRTVIAATAAAMLLAGCASAPPVTGATPSLEAEASLIDTQAASVIDATFAELDAADAAKDADLFESRVAGDAALVREAEYTVAKKVDDASRATLPSTMQGVYVSRSDTWPRMMAAVSEPPADDLTPVVYLWVQESVQEPYQLVAWAHMIPGAVLPAMPGQVNGAEPLSLGRGWRGPVAAHGARGLRRRTCARAPTATSPTRSRRTPTRISCLVRAPRSPRRRRAPGERTWTPSRPIWAPRTRSRRRTAGR